MGVSLPSSRVPLLAALLLIAPAGGPAPALSPGSVPAALVTERGTAVVFDTSAGSYAVDGVAVARTAARLPLAGAGTRVVTVPVFTFSAIDLAPGTAVTVRGSNPLYLAARGAVSIAGDIRLDGAPGARAGRGAGGGGGGGGGALVVLAGGRLTVSGLLSVRGGAGGTGDAAARDAYAGGAGGGGTVVLSSAKRVLIDGTVDTRGGDGRTRGPLTVIGPAAFGAAATFSGSPLDERAPGLRQLATPDAAALVVTGGAGGGGGGGSGLPETGAAGYARAGAAGGAAGPGGGAGGAGGYAMAGGSGGRGGNGSLLGGGGGGGGGGAYAGAGGIGGSGSASGANGASGGLGACRGSAGGGNGGGGASGGGSGGRGGSAVGGSGTNGWSGNAGSGGGGGGGGGDGCGGTAPGTGGTGGSGGAGGSAGAPGTPGTGHVSAEALDAEVCPLIVSMDNGPFDQPPVLEIRSDGDIYVNGEFFWDCPPYETSGT